MVKSDYWLVIGENIQDEGSIICSFLFLSEISSFPKVSVKVWKILGGQISSSAHPLSIAVKVTL